MLSNSNCLQRMCQDFVQITNCTHLGNNSSDASIARKTSQVPVVGLLEDVHLVPDECLQVQILLHLETIYFLSNTPLRSQRQLAN